MQSDNLDDELVALGFTRAEPGRQSVYDVNATFGGPIVQDRLWFFSTFRRWSAEQLSSATRSRPPASRRVDDQRITDATLRLTVQADAAATSSRCTTTAASSGAATGRTTGSRASINEPVSSVVQTTRLNYIGEVKWSSPISNRLLAEVSVFTLPVNYNLSFQPDAAPDAVATFDQIRSVITGVSPRQDINTARMCTYAGFMSYVTGAHNFKAGVQVRTG